MLLKMFFRMELMNKDLSRLSKDFVLNPALAFKQDPKLVAAIDKLWRQQVTSLNKVDGMLLPQRKLDFTEVQNMLKETAKPKGPKAIFRYKYKKFVYCLGPSSRILITTTFQYIFSFRKTCRSHS